MKERCVKAEKDVCEQKAMKNTLKWMKIPSAEEKMPDWKEFGMCCENLYNSTKEEYSGSGEYPMSAPILRGDDNGLFIGEINDRLEFCPWCGKEVNNG